ncbi:MAG: TIGR00269 family protein [Methanobacteriaceae archaeon]|nr:TIGR00269 family protein [Methanobacteriaceae archaeon]
MQLEKNKFNKYIQDTVNSTITEYNLIEEDDKIIVAISGGKDSILTLQSIYQFHEISDLNFSIEAVCIDEGISGYRNKGIDAAKKNCKDLDIPLTIRSFKDEWDYNLDDIAKLYKSTCMPCGVFRRYLINKVGDQLSASKIATGHNLDDEIQSFLMTLSHTDIHKFSKFTPHLNQIHPHLIPRIKPLWKIPEKDVGIWCVLNGITIHQEECPYSKTSLRSKVKYYLNDLEEKKPGSKKAIFNSFKKTFNLKQADVTLIECEECGQASALNICKACQMDKEIKELL